MPRVLVVDDNPWTQRMVSSVLVHQGHTVELAADGWEALISAGRSRPDLVIVDIQLPTTDGWRLMETLRSRPELGHVPALFLTTFMDEEVRGPSFRTTTDDTMAKPFRLEDLLAKVSTLLGRPRLRSGAPSDGPPTSRSTGAPPPVPGQRPTSRPVGRPARTTVQGSRSTMATAPRRGLRSRAP